MLISSGMVERTIKAGARKPRPYRYPTEAAGEAEEGTRRPWWQRVFGRP
jgi:hypothetical protein